MARLSTYRIEQFFRAGDLSETMTDKGRALEDLICYIFERIPGIEVTRRNVLNAFDTEEIDVAFWNTRQRNGLYFLPNIILVECKNWSRPSGSQEVAYFVRRLENRGRDYGVLVAANGITGAQGELNRAHFEIATALGNGIHVLVVTRTEIEALNDTAQIVSLLKEKLTEMAVSGTVFL